MIDSTLTHEETMTKTTMGKEDLKILVDHSCIAKYCSLSIKKRREDDCTISAKLSGCQRMFQTIQNLPDLKMGNDNHYQSFEEVYNMKASDKDHP